MIVSHKHRFIFIKTAKTAGTSIELALSKYCGPTDIITPCSAEDEELRKSLGHRGPQNYRIPFRKYSLVALAYSLQTRRRVGFYNHNTAEFIRKYVGPEVWNSYFKFCFERNPWDKVVSSYYFDVERSKRMSLSEYVQRGFCNSIAGYSHYTIEGVIAVNRVYLYEDMQNALEEIAKVTGLPEIPNLPRAKGQFRPPNTDYRQILSESDASAISKAFAREIAHFGYAW